MALLVFSYWSMLLWLTVDCLNASELFDSNCPKNQIYYVNERRIDTHESGPVVTMTCDATPFCEEHPVCLLSVKGSCSGKFEYLAGVTMDSYSETHAKRCCRLQFLDQAQISEQCKTIKVADRYALVLNGSEPSTTQRSLRDVMAENTWFLTLQEAKASVRVTHLTSHINNNQLVKNIKKTSGIEVTICTISCKQQNSNSNSNTIVTKPTIPDALDQEALRQKRQNAPVIGTPTQMRNQLGAKVRKFPRKQGGPRTDPNCPPDHLYYVNEERPATHDSGAGVIMLCDAKPICGQFPTCMINSKTSCSSPLEFLTGVSLEKDGITHTERCCQVSLPGASNVKEECEKIIVSDRAVHANGSTIRSSTRQRTERQSGASVAKALIRTAFAKTSITDDRIVKSITRAAMSVIVTVCRVTCAPTTTTTVTKQPPSNTTPRSSASPSTGVIANANSRPRSESGSQVRSPLLGKGKRSGPGPSNDPTCAPDHVYYVNEERAAETHETGAGVVMLCDSKPVCDQYPTCLLSQKTSCNERFEYLAGVDNLKQDTHLERCCAMQLQNPSALTENCQQLFVQTKPIYGNLSRARTVRDAVPPAPVGYSMVVASLRRAVAKTRGTDNRLVKTIKSSKLGVYVTLCTISCNSSTTASSTTRRSTMPQPPPLTSTGRPSTTTQARSNNVAGNNVIGSSNNQTQRGLTGKLKGKLTGKGRKMAPPTDPNCPPDHVYYVHEQRPASHENGLGVIMLCDQKPICNEFPSCILSTKKSCNREFEYMAGIWTYNDAKTHTERCCELQIKDKENTKEECETVSVRDRGASSSMSSKNNRRISRQSSNSELPAVALIRKVFAKNSTTMNKIVKSIAIAPGGLDVTICTVKCDKKAAAGGGGGGGGGGNGGGGGTGGATGSQSNQPSGPSEISPGQPGNQNNQQQQQQSHTSQGNSPGNMSLRNSTATLASTARPSAQPSSGTALTRNGKNKLFGKGSTGGRSQNPSNDPNCAADEIYYVHEERPASHESGVGVIMMCAMKPFCDEFPVCILSTKKSCSGAFEYLAGTYIHKNGKAHTERCCEVQISSKDKFKEECQTIVVSDRIVPANSSAAARRRLSRAATNEQSFTANATIRLAIVKNGTTTNRIVKTINPTSKGLEVVVCTVKCDDKAGGGGGGGGGAGSSNHGQGSDGRGGSSDNGGHNGEGSGSAIPCSGPSSGQGSPGQGSSGSDGGGNGHSGSNSGHNENNDNRHDHGGSGGHGGNHNEQHGGSSSSNGGTQGGEHAGGGSGNAGSNSDRCRDNAQESSIDNTARGGGGGGAGGASSGIESVEPRPQSNGEQAPPGHSVAVATLPVNPNPGCFPENSIVYTKTGPKWMRNLRVGDYVLTANGTEFGSNLVYEPVEWFLHKIQNSSTSYIALTTRAGRKLALSPYHLLPLVDCHAALSKNILNTIDKKSVFALRAKPGDCTLGIENGNRIITDEVMEVRTVLAEGLYSPVTKSGNIVVDGILTSCFSHVENHRFASDVFGLYASFMRFLGRITGNALRSDSIDIPTLLRTALNVASHIVW